MAERAAVVRRILSAPPEEVFAAWTDPEGMRQWMSPMGSAAMTMDLRVGGEFELVMADEHLEIHHSGVYRDIEPPSLLAFTWRSEYTGGRETLVTVRLTPHGEDQTELVLTHEQLPPDQVKPHGHGWQLIVAKLEAYLQPQAGRGR